MGRFNVTDTMRSKIIALHADKTLSIDTIALRFGVSHACVTGIWRKAGLQRRTIKKEATP